MSNVPAKPFPRVNRTGVVPDRAAEHGDKHLYALGKASPMATSDERWHVNQFVRSSLHRRGWHKELNDAVSSLSKKEGGLQRGAQVYRALTQFDVNDFSKLKVGEHHVIDSPMSFVGADELNTVGKMAAGKKEVQGGVRYPATGSFEVMGDNVPGINNVNRYTQGNANPKDNVKGFDSEGMFGPGARLELRERTPATANTPEHFHFRVHPAASSQQLGGN